MKKLLILLAIVLNSFLIIDNVSAEETVSFPKNMFDYIHMINTKDMTNEEVTSMMTEKGFSEDYVNGYLNFKNFINEKQQDGKYYFFAPGSGSNLYSSRLYINLSLNGLLAYFGIYYESTTNDNYAYPILNVRVSDSNTSYYSIASTSDYTVKLKSSAQWITKVRATNKYLYESDLQDVYYFYETNMSIPISYSSDTGVYTEDLIINNETYTLNSTLPYNTLDGVNSLIDYGYNETIDVTDVDYIKVKIDVNDIIENSGNLEIKYDISSENNYEISPYIETLYYDENGYMVQNKDTMESTDNLAYCLLQDLNTTVYYDLVIPTAAITGNINLYFKSQLSYEVVLYYSNGSTSNDEIYNSTLTKLDLTDYKGIIIMPKLYSDTDDLAQIYSAIHYDGYKNVSLSGIYDIFVFGVPGNYTTLVDSYIDYDKSNFSYPFNFDDPQQNKLKNYIKFIKKESSEESYIILDTNLFTYSYIINEIDDVIIQDANFPHINHNTGNVDDTYKLYDANKSLKDVDTAFDKILSFIDDMSDCMFAFSDLITFTYNSLNSYCQNFIVITFTILVIVGIILILRR